MAVICVALQVSSEVRGHRAAATARPRAAKCGIVHAPSQRSTPPSPIWISASVLVHDGFEVTATDHLSLEQDLRSLNECALFLRQELPDPLILTVDNATDFAINIARGFL